MHTIAVRFTESPKSAPSMYFIGAEHLAPVADLLPRITCAANGTLRQKPLAKRDEWKRRTTTLTNIFNARINLNGPPCPLPEAVERVIEAIRVAYALQHPSS